jgi:uncharacterized protein DUF6375
MKIWVGHGSEHSYNLVLIGHFTDGTKALNAKQKFQRLKGAAETELPEVGWESDQRFPDGLFKLLEEIKYFDLSRSDIENFAYEHTVEVSGNDIRIETDEGEIQGFLKVLIDSGARIEIYSAHEWTDDGQPRSPELDKGSTQDAEG